MIGGCIDNIQDPPSQEQCNWVNSKIKCTYVNLKYPNECSFNPPDSNIYSFTTLFEHSDFTNSEAQIDVSVSSEVCIGNTNHTTTINQNSYSSHIIEDDCTINGVSFINNINPKELSINITFKINNILEYNSLKEGDIIWNLSTDGYSEGYVFDSAYNKFSIQNLILEGKFTPNYNYIPSIYSAGRYIQL